MTDHPSRPPEGDPVRELMERHRELCERATHPLEIAAGLEAAGVGPAAVARCRHADVFSLAEELYARVPRRTDPSGPAPWAPGPWRRRAGASLLAALLHALPCAAFAAIRAVAPQSSPWALLSAAAVAGVWYAATFLETARWQGGRSHAGPGDGPHPALRVIGAAGVGAVLTMPLLLPFAGVGDPVPPVAPAALAVGMGAAEWSVRWFRHAGQAHLDSAATAREFRLRMLPVLPMAAALHLGAVALLTWAVVAVRTPHGAEGAFDGTRWGAQEAAALLLVLALLLFRGGCPGAAAAGLAGAVCGVGLLLAVRALPLPVPGRSLLVSHAPAALQLAGCGAAAALMLPYAWAALTRPGAHRAAPPPSAPARPGFPARAPLTEGPTPS